MSKFTTDNQPSPEKKKRGKSFKTKLFEAIREKAELEVGVGATSEEQEQSYLHHIAKRAFNPDDPNSAMCLKMLTERMYPPLKANAAKVNFEFDPTLKPHEQASQVLKAAADGCIAPDVAQIFISSIQSMLKIEEVTELTKRLDAIEAQING